MESQTNKISNKQIDKLVIESRFPMNSMSIIIPYSYISKVVNLNWYDIKFAINNGFMYHQSAIEHAMVELENDDSQNVLDLACLSLEETTYPHSIHPYVDELANKTEDQDQNKTKEKFLYVLLNWVFENKECYEDPLRVVELIYEDFNFPKSIVNFVRYMLTTQPILATMEENIKRLFDNWKNFLDAQKIKYSA